MKLIYTPIAGMAAPPSEWPAADHDEADGAVARQKIVSGYFRAAKKEVK